MTSPAFCQHCGAALGVAARFCPGCGVMVAHGMSEGATPLTEGLAALRAGELDAAIPLLAEAAADGSGFALLAYGTALLRRRRFAEAIAPLKRAVDLLPERGEPLAYLALARLQALDPVGARADMQRALAIGSRSFPVRLKHAEFLYRLGYYREALAEAEVTLSLTAPDAESLAFAEHLAALARQRAPQAYTRQPGRLPHLPLASLLRRLRPQEPRTAVVVQPKST